MVLNGSPKVVPPENFMFSTPPLRHRDEDKFGIDKFETTKDTST